MSNFTTPRRSARLAGKAPNAPMAAKAPKELSEVTISPMTFPQMEIIAGKGSQGKSLFHKALSRNKTWSLDYTLYPYETNMKDDVILNEAIADHKALHENDEWDTMFATTKWEKEMDVATRWLCIDNRILKESAEMRAKAKNYANKVNDLLPNLYEKIKTLEAQLDIKEGREADGVHHELLMSRLLLTAAEHVHQKWNIVMNEWLQENGVSPYHLSVCGNKSGHEWEEVFKPEMPIDTYDESV